MITSTFSYFYWPNLVHYVQDFSLGNEMLHLKRFMTLSGKPESQK